MGKIILTYNDIADLNQYLMTNGAEYKVHMHDLCGSQSFSLSSLNASEEAEQTAVKQKVINYFSDKGITLKFAENGMDFVIL